MEEIRKIIMMTGDGSDENPENDDQQFAVCSVCGELLQDFFRDRAGNRITFMGHSTHPRRCACQRAEDEARAAEREHERHVSEVNRLSSICFAGNTAMRELTFDASKSDNSAVVICKKYAEGWEKAKAENLGMLLWGDVGTGKSYMAASIANALLKLEVSVRMLNLSDVMNATFESREVLLREVRQCSLLIIDDYGMERDTEFGNEIAFQVIDARYQSRKPLIVTTNLSLNTLTSPKDTDHKRVYDRILEMCSPVHFEGSSLRPDIRKRKMDRLGEILGIKKEGEE